MKPGDIRVKPSLREDDGKRKRRTHKLKHLRTHVITAEMKRAATRPYRLGIVTALWGRSKLTEHVLRYYAGFKAPRVEFVLVAVRSPEDADPAPDVPGWQYIEAHNEPLGQKFNAGLSLLSTLGVDAVMVVGSDDLVSAGYVDLVLTQMRKGTDHVAVRDLFIYCPPGKHVLYCESMPSGAGRVVSRRALDMMRWKLWDDDAPRYLDGGAQSRLSQVQGISQHTVRNLARRSFAVLDIKAEGGPSMWTVGEPDARGKRLLVSSSGDTAMTIRKSVELPAGDFFNDYFPTFDYTAL